MTMIIAHNAQFLNPYIAEKLITFPENQQHIVDICTFTVVLMLSTLK
jgi:hypothetical protein